MKEKLLRWGGRIFLAAGGIVLLILGICGCCLLPIEFSETPRAGNAPAALAKISSGAPSFRFGVLGDSQKGLGSINRLFTRLNQEGPDFHVHTGDLVSRNDDGHYELARQTLSQEVTRPWMLTVPGNHDIKGGPERFEAAFGPREYSFDRGGLSFFTLDNALASRWENDWLEAELKKVEGRKIVLFLHVPPFDPRKPAFAPAEGWEPFVELCRKFKVAYVFSGHAHGYVRHEDQGTVYIANGIGGDSDSWQYGQRVMATMVEVAPGKVRDWTVEIEPRVGMAFQVQHLAIGHVGEAYRRLPIPLWSATWLLTAGWLFLAVRAAMHRWA